MTIELKFATWFSNLFSSLINEKQCFFDLNLEIWAFSFVTASWSELMACPDSRESRQIMPFLFQKDSAHHFACILNIFIDGEFACHLSWDYFYSCSDFFFTNVQLMFFILLRVFVEPTQHKHCQHYFKYVEVNNQFYTQLLFSISV